MNTPEWLVVAIEALKGFLEDVWQAIQADRFLQILCIAVVVGILYLLISWALEPTAAEKRRRAEKRLAAIKPVFRPNPTNGLEHVLYGYPVVFRLKSQDGEKEGVYVKIAPGNLAFLRLGQFFYRVHTIRQLTEEQIDQIQDALKESNEIEFQGQTWEVQMQDTFEVKVEKGSPPYFPGKEGAIDYKIAFSNKEGFILLENPYIPHKPSKLRTWTASLLEDISLEVFQESTRDAVGG